MPNYVNGDLCTHEILEWDTCTFLFQQDRYEACTSWPIHFLLNSKESHPRLLSMHYWKELTLKLGSLPSLRVLYPCKASRYCSMAWWDFTDVCIVEAWTCLDVSNICKIIRLRKACLHQFLTFKSLSNLTTLLILRCSFHAAVLTDFR